MLTKAAIEKGKNGNFEQRIIYHLYKEHRSAAHIDNLAKSMGYDKARIKVHVKKSVYLVLENDIVRLYPRGRDPHTGCMSGRLYDNPNNAPTVQDFIFSLYYLYWDTYSKDKESVLKEALQHAKNNKLDTYSLKKKHYSGDNIDTIKKFAKKFLIAGGLL